MSSIPPYQQDAHEYVADLIKVVADPKGAEKRLKEYGDLLQKNTAALAEAKKVSADADTKLDTAHTAHAVAAAKALDNAAKEKQLTGLANELDERQRTLVVHEQEALDRHAKRDAMLNDKEAELKRREAMVAVTEKQMGVESARLDADRKALDAQMVEARRFLKV